MSFDDMTVRELKAATDLMVQISTATLHHAITILTEPDHVCENEWDDATNDPPTFTDFDVRVFLALEDSAQGIFAMVRDTMRKAGYTELREKSTQ